MSHSMIRRAVAIASLSLLAACGAPGRNAMPATSAHPQTYPLVTASGETAGYLLASHDAWNLSLQFVMNPGYQALGATACAAAHGWSADDCGGWNASTVAPVRQASLTIALPDLEASVGRDLCEAPVLLEASTVAVGDSATSIAWAGAYKGRFAFAFSCDPAPQYAGCVRDGARWLADSSSWPVETLPIGGVVYKQQELQAFLGDTSSNDASVILARALIAARLSEASGAQVPPAIATALADADAWSVQNADGDGRLPYAVNGDDSLVSNGAAWDDAVATASVIDRFSKGDFGPVACP